MPSTRAPSVLCASIFHYGRHTSRGQGISARGPVRRTDESEIGVSGKARGRGHTGAAVLRGAGGASGGRELLELARDREDIALVGGRARPPVGDAA